MSISLEKFDDVIKEIIEKREYVENSSRFLNYILEKKFYEVIEPIQRIIIRRENDLEFCDYKSGTVVLDEDFLYVFYKEKPLLCFTFDNEEGKNVIRVLVNRTRALTEEELDVLENLLERLDLKISEKYFKIKENRGVLSWVWVYWFCVKNLLKQEIML